MNLRQIMLAHYMYANDHKGVYPLSLDRVIDTQDIGGDVFVCPGTTDTPATAGQPAAGCPQ